MMKTLTAVAAALVLVACSDSIPEDEQPPFHRTVTFTLKSGETVAGKVTKIEGSTIHYTTSNYKPGIVKWDQVASWRMR